MARIKLFSSDLNGTLVRQHTMSDMIRIYKGKEKFEKAHSVFKKQVNGEASMENAFQVAGPLTKGLTLRQAIDYTRDHMSYMEGFDSFIEALYINQIPLVINSTGYSVTIYAIREQFGRYKIHGQIGNKLRFGLNGNSAKTLSEKELEQKVMEYFSGTADNPIYDKIKATGEIELGISNEKAKVTLIREYCKKHFPKIKPNQIAHMGDTIGDSWGIAKVAKLGGMGIAFNPNEALTKFIENLEDSINKNIVIIKNDLKEVISYIN